MCADESDILRGVGEQAVLPFFSFRVLDWMSLQSIFSCAPLRLDLVGAVGFRCAGSEAAQRRTVLTWHGVVGMLDGCGGAECEFPHLCPVRL